MAEWAFSRLGELSCAFGIFSPGALAELWYETGQTTFARFEREWSSSKVFARFLSVWSWTWTWGTVRWVCMSATGTCHSLEIRKSSTRKTTSWAASMHHQVAAQSSLLANIHTQIAGRGLMNSNWANETPQRVDWRQQQQSFCSAYFHFPNATVGCFNLDAS